MKRILLVLISVSSFCVLAQNSGKKILHVKFEDQLAVSARSGKLLMGNEAYPQSGVLEQYGYWEPFYSIDPQFLNQYYEKAKQRLKKNLSNPLTLFEFHVNEGMDLETVKKELKSLSYLKYVSVPPKLSTPAAPDLQPTQVYMYDQAPGIHVQEFWNTYNNHGAGIKICDIEYQFNANHMDLPTVTIIGPTPGDPGYGNNHGTAVLGEIASLNNGNGTTGIAYESQLFFAGAYIDIDYYLEEALISTLTELGEGDIVLIEQQIMAFDGTPDEGYAPVEWYQPFYDAIQLISGNGIIVVEAAGNGNRDLDHPMFTVDNEGHYPFLEENWSEAIIVGAGAVGLSDVSRSRMWFSNYGSRIDVQGNGEGVVTTGYGTAYSAEGENQYYSNSFGGTSGASPIVVGAVALLQSLNEEHNGNRLTVNEIRDLLVSTGKPQVSGDLPVTEKIGPLPNVFAAANILMSGELGIEQIEKAGFSIYPNPSKGFFEVYVPNQFVQQLILRDLTGKEAQITYTKTQMGFECLNGNLAPGMYHLSVIYADGTLVTKSVQIAD